MNLWFKDLIKAQGLVKAKKHVGQTCEQAHPKTSHEVWEKGEEPQEDSDGVDY